MGDVVHDEPACLVLWGRYSMIREHALVIMPCSDIIIIVLSLDIDYRTRYAIDLCTVKATVHELGWLRQLAHVKLKLNVTVSHRICRQTAHLRLVLQGFCGAVHGETRSNRPFSRLPGGEKQVALRR
jgi:hypothetical protein